MNDDTAAPVPDPAVRLKQIADRLKEGQTVEPFTIRELLTWFGAKRRTLRNTARIKGALYDCDLHADTDISYVFMDYPIELRIGKDERDQQHSYSAFIVSLGLDDLLPRSNEEPSAKIIAFPGREDPLETRPVTTDPTYRIGKLPSANNRPVYVRPNDSLDIARTPMLANDFSQLPVMTNERDVKGVISWASMGARLAVSRECKEVRECMDEAYIIGDNTSLFDAIDTIVRCQYVLIQDSTRKISGIVTASDLSRAFGEYAEPFMLIEEVEKHLRSLIMRSGFNKDDLLQAVQEGRRSTVQNIYDLTFGDFISLLERPEPWSRVRLSIDRGEFISMLEDVRQIRNDLMHFNPDAPMAGYLDPVRKVAGLLQKLQRAWAPETEEK
jgi:CBS domain-containing protein